MLVGGCAEPNMRALRKATPSKDPYLAALSVYYLRMAEEEARLYDWFDSVHFSDKGLRAAYDHEVLPDNPDSRSLDSRFIAETKEAYIALIDRLTAKLRQDHPQEAARAVTFYDCWIEQAEEGWQFADIEACRKGFYDAMSQLEGKKSPLKKASRALSTHKMLDKRKGKPANIKITHFSESTILKHAVAKTKPVRAKSVVMKQASTTGLVQQKNEPATSHELEPVISEGRVVLFYTEGVMLSKKSALVLMQLVEKLKKMAGYRVTVHGYTDVAGDENANLELSYRRAEQIKKKLVKLGLKPDHIHVFAFGGAEPRVVAPSERERIANQRVEVLIE